MAIYNIVATETIVVPAYDEQGDPTATTYTSGAIMNVIEWDGVTPYTPPDGTELVLIDSAAISTGV